ncbi:hypothetical protein QR98_0083310 [Sarcoptes scabiei]|uniref:Uncharacterized protein n=1 Tax=Sarcoptes scabiei TaxID=52283 RepID=A0A132AFM9_SARSC|nr:hypothetical protein QR98_0083310 [Sarcoptes scabiei]
MNCLPTLTIGWIRLFPISIIFILSNLSITDQKQIDGKISKTLQEYHSTIKCVINIAEETLPELNDYIACCGFWTLHDWLLTKVNEECDNEVLDKMHHLSALISPHMQDQCISYEQGSFTCRLLVIMPITILVLIFLILIAFCICANVSLIKWIYVRRKYQRIINLQLEPKTQIDTLMGIKKSKHPISDNDYDSVTKMKRTSP